MLHTAFLHATTFQKNPLRANHETEVCITLAQIACNPKGNFLEKLADIALVQLPTMYPFHNATLFQKNPHRADHENMIG